VLRCVQCVVNFVVIVVVTHPHLVVLLHLFPRLRLNYICPTFIARFPLLLRCCAPLRYCVVIVDAGDYVCNIYSTLLIVDAIVNCCGVGCCLEWCTVVFPCWWLMHLLLLLLLLCCYCCCRYLLLLMLFVVIVVDECYLLLLVVLMRYTITLLLMIRCPDAFVNFVVIDAVAFTHCWYCWYIVVVLLRYLLLLVLPHWYYFVIVGDVVHLNIVDVDVLRCCDLWRCYC